MIKNKTKLSTKAFAQILFVSPYSCENFQKRRKQISFCKISILGQPPAGKLFPFQPRMKHLSDHKKLQLHPLGGNSLLLPDQPASLPKVSNIHQIAIFISLHKLIWKNAFQLMLLFQNQILSPNFYVSIKKNAKGNSLRLCRLLWMRFSEEAFRKFLHQSWLL